MRGPRSTPDYQNGSAARVVQHTWQWTRFPPYGSDGAAPNVCHGVLYLDLPTGQATDTFALSRHLPTSKWVYLKRIIPRFAKFHFDN